MTVMYTFKIYKDVLREIDLIQDQLFYTKQELKKWFGMDIDTGKGIPLDGYLSHKFGANAALIQANKKLKYIHRLNSRLYMLNKTREHWENIINSFEGLDYKIAYYRIVHDMTHQEIADLLNYSHQYIKERWSRIKTYKQPTDSIVI